MEFKNLSCAIAHVINSYHAHQTKTPLIATVDLDAPLETIEQMLHDKILEATTGSNSHSSRGTLLEYMLRGMKLSERARFTETPDEIEALKPQLVQFFQNIQQLFKGPYLNMLTSRVFASSTLFIPADETNHFPSLSIYYLNTPSTTAYQLTHELLTTLGLSPDSTVSTVEKHIGELFFAKKHHALLENNATLKLKIQTLNQTNKTYEQQINQKTNAPSGTEDQADEKKTAMDTDAYNWEMVGFNSEKEKVAHLTDKNGKLQKRYEELQERSQMLKKLLQGLPSKATPHVFKAPSKANVVTEQPKNETVAIAASTSNLNTKHQRPTIIAGILMHFLFPPKSDECNNDAQQDKYDNNLEKYGKFY